MPVIAVVTTAAQGDEALHHGLHGYLLAETASWTSLRHVGRHAFELRRARLSLRETKERLLHADRLASIGRLTAGVIHEINNPTAALLANLTVLREQIDDARRARHAGRNPGRQVNRDRDDPTASVQPLDTSLTGWAEIVSDGIDAVEHMSSIARELRSFSRVGNDAHSAISIDRAIEDAFKLTGRLVGRRARLVKDLRAGQSVLGDHGKLVQVFTNLLANAAQAIEGPAASNEIRVTSRARDGMIVTTVEDTGVGLADGAAKLIFEPFFTTKARDSGTGLGLALAAEIVRDHGGAIDAAPRESGGARFEVHLPLARPALLDRGSGAADPHDKADRTDTSTSTTGASPPAPTRYGNGRRSPRPVMSRVLLIDDEPGLLRAFRRLLSPRHEIVMAVNGGQALDILAQDTAFDGVICDFSMPGVDGIEIYRAVAEIDRELAGRIVFCTGGPMSRRGQRFIASTANTVLVKPVRPDRLIGAIEQLGKR